MKKYLVFLFIPVLLYAVSCRSGSDAKPKVSAGKVLRLTGFKSKLVAARNIDVWLPEGYSANEKYAVLYMNDGQMLFDSTITWNKEEWQVDEVVSELIKEGKIRKCIVVGISSLPDLRQNEYLPYIILDGIPDPAKSSLLTSLYANKPKSDYYVNFIVKELKPAIDSLFSTEKDRSNTFIAGSGLGGIISIYALCTYPDVFGGVASLSTHWPVIGPGLYNEKIINGASGSFLKFFTGNLHLLHGSKFYFDHGTTGLDSEYGHYQGIVDSYMLLEGYQPDNWMTKTFDGLSGDERSIAKRLSYPIHFLLAR
jgi:hypothetical protein